MEKAPVQVLKNYSTYSSLVWYTNEQSTLSLVCSQTLKTWPRRKRTEHKSLSCRVFFSGKPSQICWRI